MSAPVPFFSTPERCAALAEAARGWLGTPFAHNGRVRGPLGGACCHGLVWGVLADAGWQLPEAMPLGQAGHARHSSAEIVRPWLDARCGPSGALLRAEAVAVEWLRPGDITTHRLGLCTHHVALVVPGGYQLETWSRRCAALRPLADPDATKRMTAAYRPLELFNHDA